MRSEINVIPRGRGFKDPKERTISSSRLPQVQLRGIFERYKGDLIDHVNPLSSRDQLEGFWSNERKPRMKRRQRGRRRWGRNEEDGSFNKNLTSGPLCEGNHSKRSRRGTAVSLPEGRHEKRIVKRKETKMGNACRGWPINFSMGKTKCADRAPACCTLRFHFAEKHKIRQIASLWKRLKDIGMMRVK